MFVKIAVEAVENLSQTLTSSLIEFLKKGADQLYFLFRIAGRYA
jgi:hypothetical protein